MTTKEIEIQLALGSLSTRALLDLASNPGTPKKILTTLSTNEDWLIRCYIIENPSTPKRILTKLLGDKHWLVKYTSLQKIIKQDKPDEQTS